VVVRGRQLGGRRRGRHLEVRSEGRRWTTGPLVAAAMLLTPVPIPVQSQRGGSSISPERAASWVLVETSMVTPCRPLAVRLGGAGSARSDGRVGIVLPDNVDLVSRRALLSQLITPPAIASNYGPTSATRRS
jgi:hypothetical protein